MLLLLLLITPLRRHTRCLLESYAIIALMPLHTLPLLPPQRALRQRFRHIDACHMLLVCC